MTNDKQEGHAIDSSTLPEKYPTDKHEAVFWESLGRAVATFGFLEEVLSKAIYSLPSILFYPKYIRTVLKERVTGVDLFKGICEKTDKKIFLLGAKPGIAERTANPP